MTSWWISAQIDPAFFFEERAFLVGFFDFFASAFFFRFAIVSSMYPAKSSRIQPAENDKLK